MSPARTTRVFDSIDWVSIPLVAMGFLCMSGFLMLGKTLWWTDTPLIGILIVGTIVIFFVVFLIERFRAQPLLDLRYLFRPTILRILLAAVLARFLMGEQSVAATGLLELNGIGNDEMVGFGFATLGGGLLGILFHLLTLKKLQWGSWQLLIAFGVISVCAFIDGATSNPLTRPWNMYPTQAAVTFAAVLFTAPALADGISRFILAGNRYYFITWVVFYILTQVGGSLAASAVFGSFQKIRTSVHYASLSDVITLSDPNVVARIAAYGGGLDGAKALSEEVNYQAGVSAYIDLFYLIGYLSLFTFVAFGMLKIFQLTTRDGLPFNQLLAKLVVK